MIDVIKKGDYWYVCYDNEKLRLDEALLMLARLTFHQGLLISLGGNHTLEVPNGHTHCYIFEILK